MPAAARRASSRPEVRLPLVDLALLGQGEAFALALLDQGGAFELGECTHDESIGVTCDFQSFRARSSQHEMAPPISPAVPSRIPRARN
jgi:hypothetical protein